MNPYGQSLLDISVMNFDAETAVKLLKIFCTQSEAGSKLELTIEMAEAILQHGLDFYREICCGMGNESTSDAYIRSVQSSGSTWDRMLLVKLFESLREIPFNVNVVPHCEFLHFSTSRQIISSGTILTQNDLGSSSLNTCLSINNEIDDGGQFMGKNAWVEGCRMHSTLMLGGENIVIGVDVDEPLSLPEGMCLDVTQGNDRKDENVWFVGYYGVNDAFNISIEQGAQLCGLPVLEWLEIVGAEAKDVREDGIPTKRRSLWNTKIFPAIKEHSQYGEWLWMLNPNEASGENYKYWLKANRYSSAEIATRADHKAFYRRRSLIRSVEIHRSLRKMFRLQSEFSSGELAYLLRNELKPSTWIADVLAEARWRYDNDHSKSLDSMIFPRILHTLGSTLLELEDEKIIDGKTLAAVSEILPKAERHWLDSIGLGLDSSVSLKRWAQHACGLAFQSLDQSVISSGGDRIPSPHSALRSDEIVWGRAPARFDTGGGWTDTPPYSLEHGGCAVDTAVDLNGQPLFRFI